MRGGVGGMGLRAGPFLEWRQKWSAMRPGQTIFQTRFLSPIHAS